MRAKAGYGGERAPAANLGGPYWFGLDPSIASFGWAVCCAEGVVDLGAWRTKVDSKSGKFADKGRRSEEIGRALLALLQSYRPKRAFIEAPALMPRDGKLSVHASARVRGLAEGLCLAHGVTLVELGSQKVKRAITGDPGASKEQVARRLMQIFPVARVLDAGLDATDALAVAVVGDAGGLWGAPIVANVVANRPDEGELDLDF